MVPTPGALAGLAQEVAKTCVLASGCHAKAAVQYYVQQAVVSGVLMAWAVRMCSALLCMC